MVMVTVILLVMANTSTCLIPSVDRREFQEDMKRIAAYKVGDLMSKPPIYAYEDTPLSDIATLIVERKVNRVPIVNEVQEPGENVPSQWQCLEVVDIQKKINSAPYAHSFTLFFGGNLQDALVAFVCGALTRVVFRAMEYVHTNLLVMANTSTCLIP